MQRVVNSRIRLLLLVILLAFGALLARATWIQTVRASALAAKRQSQTKVTVVLPAGRGTIFDRLGSPLALGEQATTVVADPMQITHPRQDAQVAAHVLGLKAAKLYPLLADRSRGFVYVERKAPPDKASALAKRNLPGFTFYGEERRVYPQKSVAAPVLGYAGIDNQGLAGLEFGLNSELAGKPGDETVVRDPFGRVIDVQNERPARDGHDVFLTLDHTIQAQAEQVLRQTVRTWGAKDATAIVLDPHTGGVLAMAMEPGYDANRYPAAAGEGAAGEPCRRRRVRAGLRLQGGHDRGRALGGARRRRRRSSRCRTRSRSPTASSTTPSRVRPRRSASRRSSSARRTSAPSRSPRSCSARRG